LEPDDSPELTLPAEFLADPGPGPEALAEAAELRTKVWQALGKLSPRQRAAIVQRYYLGLSEAEMAEELAVSRGSIKRHLHSARKQLRSLLQPLWASLSKTERSL
jgi:RNA polymerase sigma-70 factor (ECF subfamily)